MAAWAAPLHAPGNPVAMTAAAAHAAAAAVMTYATGVCVRPPARPAPCGVVVSGVVVSDAVVGESLCIFDTTYIVCQQAQRASAPRGRPSKTACPWTTTSPAHRSTEHGLSRRVRLRPMNGRAARDELRRWRSQHPNVRTDQGCQGCAPTAGKSCGDTVRGRMWLPALQEL